MPPASPVVHHTYAATVRYVIDGDTIAMDVDCGFHVVIRMSCRLLGIDAPERGTAAGKAATGYLGKLLPAGTKVIVDSVGVDKYGGRFDARCWVAATGQNVTETLISTGNARVWASGDPKPYLPAKG